MAAAEASLTTEIEATSLGLIFIRSPSAPSTSTSGEPPLIEVMPRMLRLAGLPGRPDEVETVSPGTEPCSMRATEGADRFCSCFSSTVAMAPVRFTFFWVP